MSAETIKIRARREQEKNGSNEPNPVTPEPETEKEDIQEKKEEIKTHGGGTGGGRLPTLLEEIEIPIPGHVGCPHIPPDNLYLNIVIGRDHHWPQYAFLDIASMIAFLPIEDEPVPEKDALKGLPVDGGYTA
jgi:hypothetical protein